MAGELAFGNNFTRGMSGVLGVLDQVDRRKERQEDRALQAEDRKYRDSEREYASTRRSKLDEHQDLLMEQSQEDRTQRLADADTTRTRAEEQNEHLKEMRPLELNLRRVQTSGAYLDMDVKKAQLQTEKQEAATQEASQIAMQAMALLEGGDVENAATLHQQLAEKYGFPMEAMKDGTASKEVMNVTQKIVQGEMEIDSPEAEKAVTMLLQPSLVMSGRDPERWEPARLEQLKNGNYGVWLRDKSNGREVPATLIHSDQDNDLMTEITPMQLVQASTNFISHSRKIEQGYAQKLGTQLKGMAGRLGVEPTKRDSSMAQFRAEQQQEQDQFQREQFVESFQGGPGSGVAGLLIAEDNFDPQSAGQIVSATSAMMADNEELQPHEALSKYRNETVIKEQIPMHAESLRQRHRGITEEQAMKLAIDMIKRGWTMNQADQKAQEMIGNKTKKEERAQSRLREQEAVSQAPAP